MTEPSTIAPRILYLEDDGDIRDLLADLLRNAGYDVTALGTAEAALAALQARQFALLLTDFRLPYQNADWLLATACAANLLTQTAVIVLTAERDPPGIDEFQMLQKPVDVAVLLSHISRRIEHRGPARERAPPSDGALVSLRLYLSSSLESLNAERHLRALLMTIDSATGRPLNELVSLQVFDVTRHSMAMLDAVEEDRIIVTPTLVRRAPGGRASFLGDLSGRGVIETMLREAIDLATRERAPTTETRLSSGAP